MSAELVAWLRSILDEEERIARRVEGRWTAVSGGYGPEVRVDGDVAWQREVNVQVWQCDDEDDGCPDAARGWMAEANHIALHDPTRVLADVRVKRRILDRYETALDAVDVSAGTVLAGAAKLRHGAYEVVLKLLAEPYQDRPGFREEWRPT